jgi:putative oxidoreductase
MPPKPSRLYVPALARLYESTWPLVEAILRVATGLLLLPHGAQKLFGMFGGGGLAGMVQVFDRMGYWPGAFWAPFVGCLQFFGGILLAIGLVTRPIAFLLFILFLFSIYFHLPFGFFALEGGVEYVILWAAALLFFAIRGGNEWSIDAKMKKEF